MFFFYNLFRFRVENAEFTPASLPGISLLRTFQSHYTEVALLTIEC